MIDEKKFIELYNSGLVLKYLATRFDLTINKCRTYAKELEEAGKIKSRKGSFPDDEQARKDYIENKGNIHTLANKYRFSKKTVGDKLRQLSKDGKLPEYGKYEEEARAVFKNHFKVYYANKS